MLKNTSEGRHRWLAILAAGLSMGCGMDDPGLPAAIQNTPEAPSKETCGLSTLRAPSGGCPDTGDSDFEAACFVDCLGNTFSMQRNDWLVIPAGRFFGVYLKPRGATPPPMHVSAHASVPAGGDIDSGMDMASALNIEVLPSLDRSIFVKIDREMETGEFVQLNLWFMGPFRWTFPAWVDTVPVRWR